MLTRILASSVRIIPWTLGSPFLSFFITGGGGGGFCALAMGLQRYIKAMGGGGGAIIYIYIYAFSRPFYPKRLTFVMSVHIYISENGKK